jgi:hypothetical protein
MAIHKQGGKEHDANGINHHKCSLITPLRVLAALIGGIIQLALCFRAE